MVYNSSEKERNQSAARDLMLKLKYEKGFRIDIRRLFRKISTDFERLYSSSGVIIPATRYKGELTDILKRNYRIIQKGFSSQIRMGLKSNNLIIETKQLDYDIDKEIDAYIDMHGEAQSNIITQTNQKEMNEAIQRIKEVSIASGVIYERQEIASKASRNFLRDGLARSDLIATTETQNISERTKWIEATIIANSLYIINNERLTDRTKKQWSTVLDERTRESHSEADGQIVDTNEPFIIQGQRLMIPGDSTLGATPDNFINCRCSSIYIVE